MRLHNALLILFLLVALNGCATIIHGTTQDISITTDPADADLLIDGREHHKSPAIITMKRKDDHTVEISRQGYKSETVAIKGTMSLAVAGNFLAGGAIGYGIDAATGAQRRLVPEKVEMRLQPLTPGEVSGLGQKNLEEKLQQLKILKDERRITQEQYDQVRQEILSAPGKEKTAPRARAKAMKPGVSTNSRGVYRSDLGSTIQFMELRGGGHPLVTPNLGLATTGPEIGKS